MRKDIINKRNSLYDIEMKIFHKSRRLYLDQNKKGIQSLLKTRYKCRRMNKSYYYIEKCKIKISIIEGLKVLKLNRSSLKEELDRLKKGIKAFI